MAAGTAALVTPRTGDEIENLVVRMVMQNRDWGYRRIQGALANLGHEVGRGTIANILKKHGLEPAPERNRKTTWKEFLSRHWEVIAAADFFTVEVWTPRGLQRLSCCSSSNCRHGGLRSRESRPRQMACG